MNAGSRHSPWTIVARLVRLGGPIAIGRTAIIGMGIVDLVVVGQFAGDEVRSFSTSCLASLAGYPRDPGGLRAPVGKSPLTPLGSRSGGGR
jgi:hypothetical protein